MNDKLFRGIDRDPLELVQHAESECRAWFDANDVVQPVVQDNIPEWMRLGMDGQCWEHSTYGNKEFHSTRISLAFGSRSTAVGNREYAATLNMSELRDRLQGADCNDKGPTGVAKLCDRIGEDRDVTDMLPGLQHHSCFTGAQ
uniref:Uncharacterized protein n=1 Tax=Brassica oleracea var. oleracea TaxID=109376 RepID=A0A0D3E6J6_BRAOL